jgi:hypothetical protein
VTSSCQHQANSYGDEGSRVDTRKKPVKVSFDDEAEVVNAAASPPTSPEEYPTLPSGDKEVPRGCFNADFTGDTDLGGGWCT